MPCWSQAMMWTKPQQHIYKFLNDFQMVRHEFQTKKCEGQEEAVIHFLDSRATWWKTVLHRFKLQPSAYHLLLYWYVPESCKQEHVLFSSTAKHFQNVYEGEIWCICTVTFGQNFPKLNSRPVYAHDFTVFGRRCFEPDDQKKKSSKNE